MNITKTLLNKLQPYLAKNNSPRWAILVIDILISLASVLLAYLLRFNFALPDTYVHSLYFTVPLILFVRVLFFVIFRVYAHIIRYTSLEDIKKVIFTVFSGTSVLLVLTLTNHYYQFGFRIPLSVILIEFLITTYLMTNLRLLVKYIYMVLRFSENDVKKVVIFGTKELAVLTKEALELDRQNKYKVVAFLDIGKNNKKKKLLGITIFSFREFGKLLDKHDLTHLIFAKSNLKNTDRETIAQICIAHDIKMLTVPDIHSWIDGELNVTQIREVKIEDLLQRDPIILDKDHIKEQIYGKVVMITGAAGSIGTEIVRQITRYNPRQLILIDQAETPLYDLELELKEKFKFENFKILLADITNVDRISKIFDIVRPDIVYHAAAYKHVPMMENNPIEAFQNNVFGTRILADTAAKHKVDKFIMISTDKAVNPTGIMGATKRIAEMYIQSLNDVSSTNFITTRFGNVLGSNGSVIPRFMKQIREGGPITITHPDITRYFMTIPEACQLVLEASIMGKGGEIYLFDMGKAVKILDMAKNMIRLSGRLLDHDIKIKFTGLRPGEKLYEELLLASESNKPTHHPKIMVANVCKYDFNEIQTRIDQFIDPVKSQNLLSVVRLMKEMVPTYKSKNSIFEKLDAVV